VLLHHSHLFVLFYAYKRWDNPETCTRLLDEEILGIVDTESKIQQTEMRQRYAAVHCVGIVLEASPHNCHIPRDLDQKKVLGFFFSGALQPKHVAVLTANLSIAPVVGAATETVLV
jgi:hypothetical protein